MSELANMASTIDKVANSLDRMGKMVEGIFKRIDVHAFKKVVNEIEKASKVAEKSLERVDKKAKKSSKNPLRWMSNLATGFLESEKGAVKFSRRLVYAAGLFRPIQKLTVGLQSAATVTDALFESFGEAGKMEGLGKVITAPLDMTSKLLDSINAKSLVNQSNFKKGLAEKGKQRIDDTGPTILESHKKQAEFRKKVVTKAIKSATGFFSIAKKIFKFAFKFLFLAMFWMTVIGTTIKVLWPYLKKGFEALWPAIKQAFEIVKTGAMMVWEGLQGIFDFIFGDASFMDMLKSLLSLLGGLVVMALGLLSTIIWPLLQFLWEATKAAFFKFTGWLAKKWEGLSTNSKSILKLIGVAVGLISLILLWPLIWPAIVTAILVGFGAWLLKQMDFFASGGVSGGGLAVVGERGPELVNLPKGSRVHSNRESRKMVSSGGSNVINVTVNANSLNDNELRRVAEKVGHMINRKVNRNTSSSTIR